MVFTYLLFYTGAAHRRASMSVLVLEITSNGEPSYHPEQMVKNGQKMKKVKKWSNNRIIVIL